MNCYNTAGLKPISFIGFMGSGKSTVGKEIAQLISYEFIDIDEELKTWEGCSIAEIFRRSGEAYFREIESLCLENIIEKRQTVISCGGGIILNKRNRELLRQKSHVIWLRNSIETAIARCNNNERPLLNIENPFVEAKKLYKQRVKFYENTAEIIIETENKFTFEVAEEVYNRINIFIG